MAVACERGNGCHATKMDARKMRLSCGVGQMRVNIPNAAGLLILSPLTASAIFLFLTQIPKCGNTYVHHALSLGILAWFPRGRVGSEHVDQPKWESDNLATDEEITTHAHPLGSEASASLGAGTRQESDRNAST